MFDLYGGIVPAALSGVTMPPWSIFCTNRSPLPGRAVCFQKSLATLPRLPVNSEAGDDTRQNCSTEGLRASLRLSQETALSVRLGSRGAALPDGLRTHVAVKGTKSVEGV